MTRFKPITLIFVLRFLLTLTQQKKVTVLYDTWNQLEAVDYLCDYFCKLFS